MGSLTTRRVHLLAKLAFAWAAVIVARLVYIQIWSTFKLFTTPTIKSWRSNSNNRW